MTIVETDELEKKEKGGIDWELERELDREEEDLVDCVRGYYERLIESKELSNWRPDQVKEVASKWYQIWYESEGDRRWSIETQLLARLIDYELLLPSPLVTQLPLFSSTDSPRTSAPHTLLTNLSLIWEPFLNNKKDIEVERLFYNLFQPRIIRLSHATNPLVRTNAFKLLARCFPLRDPTNSIIDQSEAMDKQFNLLQDALEDTSPLVRSTVIEVICHILTVFWDLFPIESITTLLTSLTRDHAFDSSSVHCRTAVLAGLLYLLSHCPTSHDLIPSLLPFLTTLIYDPSDKVRVAYLDLLGVTQDLDDHPSPHHPETAVLIPLITHGTPSVSHGACSLLQKQLFPLTSPTKVRLRNCLTLMDQDHAAASKFLSHLPSLHPKNLKFSVALGELVIDLLHPTSSSRTKKPPNFTEIALSHLEMAAILVHSSKGHLKGHPLKRFLEVTKARVTPEFLAQMVEHYGSTTHSEVSAIFTIASFLEWTSPSSPLVALAHTVLESHPSTEAYPGAMTFLLITDRFQVHIGHLINKLLKPPPTPQNQPRPPINLRKRGLKSITPLTTTEGEGLASLIHLLTLPDALTVLIDHPQFRPLLRQLKKSCDTIFDTPSDRTDEIQLRAIDLYFRLRIQSLSSQFGSAVPDIRAGTELCREILELMERLAREGGELIKTTRSGVAMGLARLGFSLAADLLIIGYVPSKWIGPLLTTFGVTSLFTSWLGDVATFHQLQIIDQISDLLSLPTTSNPSLTSPSSPSPEDPDASGEQTSDRLRHQVVTSFQTLCQLFLTIPAVRPLKEARQMYHQLRTILPRFDRLMAETGNGREYLARLVFLLLDKQSYLPTPTSSRTTTTSTIPAIDPLPFLILLEGLEDCRALHTDPTPTLPLLTTLLRSLCDPPKRLRHLTHLHTLLSPSNPFLDLLRSAWDNFTNLEIKPDPSAQEPNTDAGEDPDAVIQIELDQLTGYFCPCRCGRYAPSEGGKVLYLDPE